MAAAPRAWQRMLSGRRLNLLDPSPLDIEIRDIAHGLSRVARWNGQTEGAWAFSVAQHSVIVEEIFQRLKPKSRPEESLTALLHDAPEYVIGDLISPFKSAIGDSYRTLEDRLFQAILVKFGLPAAPSDICARRIKKADRLSAHAEATQLAGFSAAEADAIFGKPKSGQIDGLTLEPLRPDDAMAAFLARFDALIAQLPDPSR